MWGREGGTKSASARLPISLAVAKKESFPTKLKRKGGKESHFRRHLLHEAVFSSLGRYLLRLIEHRYVKKINFVVLKENSCDFARDIFFSVLYVLQLYFLLYFFLIRENQLSTCDFKKIGGGEP